MTEYELILKPNGFDVEIKIIPGWEYQIEFHAVNNEYLFFYILYNIDNGYNTKKEVKRENK